MLSVINLYKQRIRNQADNFPRITRDDYFNLEPKMKAVFPDSNNYQNQIEQILPVFDAISSNFPIIQQEDIPNDVLDSFRKSFEKKMKLFLNDSSFSINRRSDYFVYCLIFSICFLKKDGCLSAITSNAWLGKEYGLQFKKFLLDNFHIKYIVKSDAEHWFNHSKVSTIFTVLQHGQRDEPTKFVTINFKLEETFDQENIFNQLKQIENFYADIDSCTNNRNKNWKADKALKDLFYHVSGATSVSIVSKQKLDDSLATQENWSTYFISYQLFERFENYLTQLYPKIIEAPRGVRTGWDKMYIINGASKKFLEDKFLTPYLKNPKRISKLVVDSNFQDFLFTCDKAKKT